MNLQNKITIIVKTFERKSCLVRLLQSIAKLYPHIKILIADDSKKPYKEYILRKFGHLHIDYHELPFDIGISAGRNYLLRKVDTPYFLLSDDDSVFGEHTNIERALRYLKQNNYDILGGIYYNVSVVGILTKIKSTVANLIAYKGVTNRTIKVRPSYYAGYFEIENKVLTVNFYEKTSLVKHRQVDIVNNFFIADIKIFLQTGGWDDELKIVEHFDFFLKCKKHNIKVGFLNDWGILHIIEKRSKNYNKFRVDRVEKYFKLALKKNGLTNKVEKWIN